MLKLLERLAARFLRNRATGYVLVSNGAPISLPLDGWVYGDGWYITIPVDKPITVANPDAPGPEKYRS